MSVGFRKSWNVLKGRARKLSSAVSKQEPEQQEDDDPEFAEALEKFRQMRKQFQNLQEISEAYAKAVYTMIIAERELAVALEDTEEESSGKCHSSLQQLASKRDHSADISEYINTAFNESFLLPMSMLLVADIKQCNEIKHKYYDSRLHYNACKQEVQELKDKGVMGMKLAETATRKEQATTELQAIKKSFAEKVQEIEEKRDSKFYDSIQDYISAEEKPQVTPKTEEGEEKESSLAVPGKEGGPIRRKNHKKNKSSLSFTNPFGIFDKKIEEESDSEQSSDQEKQGKNKHVNKQAAAASGKGGVDVDECL